MLNIKQSYLLFSIFYWKYIYIIGYFMIYKLVLPTYNEFSRMDHKCIICKSQNYPRLLKCKMVPTMVLEDFLRPWYPLYWTCITNNNFMLELRSVQTIFNLSWEC